MSLIVPIIGSLNSIVCDYFTLETHERPISTSDIDFWIHVYNTESDADVLLSLYRSGYQITLYELVMIIHFSHKSRIPFDLAYLAREMVREFSKEIWYMLRPCGTLIEKIYWSPHYNTIREAVEQNEGPINNPLWDHPRSVRAEKERREAFNKTLKLDYSVPTRKRKSQE